MMPDHKFLSVAVITKRLTDAQAQEIYEDQIRDQRGNNGEEAHLKVGERAVLKNYLTPEVVEIILHDQDIHRRENYFYRDVITEVPREYLIPRKLNGEVVNALRFAAGSVVLGTIVFWWAHGSWEVAAAAASIAAAVWLGLELIFPLLLNYQVPVHQRISWTRLPERVTPVLFTAAISYLVHATQGQRWVSSSLLWLSIGGLVTIYAATYVTCVWRRKRLYFFQARGDLMRLLIAVAGLRIAQVVREHQRPLLPCVQEVMKVSASVAQLDPWGQLVKRITFRKKKIIPASVWLYHLNASGDFVVSAYSAPGAPPEVIDTFDKLKASYRATKHNDKWYKAARDECSDNGRVDVREFVSRHGAHLQTSLVGWVYENSSALSSADAEGHLVFNRRHEEFVPSAKNDSVVAPWLVVNSFAACPVFVPSESKPVGVLVLWKKSRTGITAEDRNTVATTAAMIGFLLATGRGTA